MDESDVDICQASNNTDVLKEEPEEFTDDLESGSGICTCADQEKDGANDFDQECSTRPISAVSAASNVSEDCCFESNSSANHQNNGDCSRQKLQKEKKCSSGLHSKIDFQIFTPPVDKYDLDATEPDHDSLKDDHSIENAHIFNKASIDNVGVNPIAAVTDFPRSSSPTIGSDQFGKSADFEDIAAEIRNLDISKNNSAADCGSSISDDELSNLSFPDVPQNNPKDFVDRSTSIDGGSVVSGHGSAHSVSKSYLTSSVSVGGDIPNSLKDGDYYLIPNFKVQAREFCWPFNKLPLSGDRKFEEDAQWEISEKIGHGASGQCFRGYPKDKKGKGFCVKKMSQYNMEEVKALCLAAKEIYTKNISEGARKIVSFYGATIYKHNVLNVCIFMEYMEGGTVKGAILEANRQYKDGLDKIDCVHYFKDVLLALEFIHRKGIVHNDVKADNVLLTASKVEAKLCDFGKASAITEQCPGSRDVWSAGCFLLEMLGQKYSSALMSGFLKKSNVLNRLPDDVDQDTKQVLSMCFCADRRQCTAANVLTSDFFNDKIPG